MVAPCTRFQAIPGQVRQDAPVMHLLRPVPAFRRIVIAGVLLAAVGACGSNVAPTGGPSLPNATRPASTAVGSSAPSPTPGPSFGLFAFDPESIVGYYASIGYTCGAVQPSTQATGFGFQSCLLVDADGRTRAIGIVTDPEDNVADAYASVRGAATESVLDPSAILDPFAAFVGAMLGETRGEALLPWLAGHLGDTSARTTLDELTVATYSESAEDHSKLYVEIATPSYLAAPAPSGSPTASN